MYPYATKLKVSLETSLATVANASPDKLQQQIQAMRRHRRVIRKERNSRHHPGEKQLRVLFQHVEDLGVLAFYPG